MISRREFLNAVSAAAVIPGFGSNIGRAAANQSITQDDLLKFDATGQVTLIHHTDCHAQLVPL